MKDIENKKKILDNQLTIFLSKSDDRDEYNKLITAASDFFTTFEDELINKSKKSQKLDKAEIEDTLNSIENVFDFAEKYIEILNEASNSLNLPLTIPSNMLATAEAIYYKYRKTKAEKRKEKFTALGIPVTGFDNKRKMPLQSGKNNYLSLILGILFLLADVVIAYTKGVASSEQYLVFRNVLDIGTTLFFAGFAYNAIKVKAKLKKITIVAFGSVALFLILHYANPPQPPEYKPASELQKTEIKND